MFSQSVRFIAGWLLIIGPKITDKKPGYSISNVYLKSRILYFYNPIYCRIN